MSIPQFIFPPVRIAFEMTRHRAVSGPHYRCGGRYSMALIERARVVVSEHVLYRAGSKLDSRASRKRPPILTSGWVPTAWLAFEKHRLQSIRLRQPELVGQLLNRPVVSGSRENNDGAQAFSQPLHRLQNVHERMVRYFATFSSSLALSCSKQAYCHVVALQMARESNML